jgi:putative hemin transport protein
MKINFISVKIMNTTTLSDTRPSSLLEAWRGIQQAKPGIRIREAAKALDTSEAALLSTLTGDKVVRLQSPWPALLQSFKTLGRIMSLTRNDACVLEHKGTFQEIDIMGEGARAMATVIGPVESRVFFQAWTYAFAVREEKQDRVLQSIQVFDKSGEAITKIYLQEQSDEEAYRKIIEGFRHPDQQEAITTQPYPAELFSTTIDESAFLSEWAALKDTHEFFGMLRKHNVHRYRALELAAGKFTYPVDAATAPKHILDVASAAKFPIMIFAGNRGNIQIHQGKVRTIRVLERGHGGAENWLNVLDPDFNMHLRMDLVHSAWVVKKPTADGVVTSVELFDKEKNMVAQFFGLRKPGIPEREAWRKMVEDLPSV